MQTRVLRGKRAIANYLSVGETFAADLIRRGVIPSFTQGQRARAGLVRYVLVSDCDEYLDRLRSRALETSQGA